MDFTSIIELILLLAQEAIVLLILALLGFAISYVRRKISDANIETVKNIVRDAVLFAQKLYGHLECEKRFEEAMKVIVKELNSRGIKISEERLKLFIESILAELKKEYGEMWYKL